MSKTIVAASGYFSPLHHGHIDYLRKAKELGDVLVVIVNNSTQERLKKGIEIMPERDRLETVRALECVDMALLSVDTDRTVCKTLRCILPHIFANGGDQQNDSIPEAKTCEELGIKMMDGLGNKVQSSKHIIRHMINAFRSDNFDKSYLEE